MVTKTFLAAAATLALGAAASAIPRSLKAANHVMDLKRINMKPHSSKKLLSLHELDQAAASPTDLVSASNGLGYAVEITFGTEPFLVLFDTGSSDLWLPVSHFDCLSETGQTVPTSFCDFGPLFDGTFSDGAIADENFNITYGDGEFLVGTLGYEDVTLAGITVEAQEVALVEKGYWFGDGVVSGLMGFAYPSLTSAYTGTDPTTDNVNLTSAPYDPFFTNAVKQGKVDPIFSLALLRGSATQEPSGQLALGGIPTIPFNQTFTSTPLEIYQLNRNQASATQFSYYTICPEGFSYAPASNKSVSAKKFFGLQTSGTIGSRQTDPFHAGRIPVIVDSGTTLTYLPLAVASAINKAFSPPSYYSSLYGLWLNDDCGAIPPDFSVRINGVDFEVNPTDMLINPGDTTGADFCISGIQSGARVNILGDVFLKNVIAVFDVGANEMRFAPHVEY